LRAVKPDETRGKAARAKTVTQAAENGTHRELLVAMRARIARSVEDPNTPPRDLAALSRRLQDIAKEIALIDLRDQQEANESSGAAPDEAFDASAV
jgi:hypothetical protein